MSTINRVPKGFLSALDAKTSGQTPADSAGVLSPVFEMTDFYLADLTLKGTSGIQTAVNEGELSTLTGLVTVPAGELWLVKFASASWLNLSGVTVGQFSICLAIRSNQNALANQRIATPSLPLGSNATGLADLGQVSSVASFERPFFAPAGTIFGGLIESFSALPATYTGTSVTDVTYYRLEA